MSKDKAVDNCIEALRRLISETDKAGLLASCSGKVYMAVMDAEYCLGEYCDAMSEGDEL